VLDIVPMSHLLFGTDFPFWAPETTIKGLAGLKLSAADLQAIERGQCAEAVAGLPRSSVFRPRLRTVPAGVMPGLAGITILGGEACRWTPLWIGPLGHDRVARR
jgi:hypothetical protein